MPAPPRIIHLEENAMGNLLFSSVIWKLLNNEISCDSYKGFNWKINSVYCKHLKKEDVYAYLWASDIQIEKLNEMKALHEKRNPRKSILDTIRKMLYHAAFR